MKSKIRLLGLLLLTVASSFIYFKGGNSAILTIWLVALSAISIHFHFNDALNLVDDFSSVIVFINTFAICVLGSHSLMELAGIGPDLLIWIISIVVALMIDGTSTFFIGFHEGNH